MGSAQAIANLGYCYLYGRELEANLSQAIAYFKIAADRRNVDAAYKLGDIYSNPRWGVEDKELANYYFEAAGHLIMDEGFNAYNPIVTCDKLLDYPSLCLALGREKSVGGSMPTKADEKSVVVIGEDDWKAIQETLFLVNHGVDKQINERENEPLDDFDDVWGQL
ncbi:hypothetical protein [Limosilactobacillus fermentum]|uniref:hypothetical protein n=1 Tax=Limosilactobacillus fermentum TaxID=1613 RepID=UPI003D78AEC6